MYDKASLMFEQIKTAGLLYELRHNGPNKLIYAMARFNAATDDVGQAAIEAMPDTPESMVLAYLESVYNGAPVPKWLTVLEVG